MAFKIDVLINYAEADNQVSNEMDEGWVSTFKHFLELMLEQVLGEKPNIVLKSESDTLSGANLKEVATLITILSSEFTSSGKCLDNLEGFAKLTADSDSNRIFKVFRNPITPEQQPEKIRGLTGYRMYRMDIDTGRAMDFKDYFDHEATGTYWMNIVDIAFDIHETLLILDNSQTSIKNITKRKTIFLAETSHDMLVQRNIIKRELQRHGYKILPAHPLPRVFNTLDKTVKDLLSKSDISVHLIGAAYGEIPDGSDLSVVDIQNKLAIDRTAGDNNFDRMVWITPHLRSASEKQITFIENIKRDSDVASNTEILQTPLEDFKNIMRADIIEGGLDKKKKLNTFEDNSNGKMSIYLIHDKIDSADADHLKSLLEQKGYNVLLPAFKGELLDVRQQHINNLRMFDGALIYHKQVNPQWVRMKVLDLLKAPGFGRKKPMLGRGLISTLKADFNNYEQQGITIIDNDKNMDKSVEAFLEEIK